MQEIRSTAFDNVYNLCTHSTVHYLVYYAVNASCNVLISYIDARRHGGLASHEKSLSENSKMGS